MATVDVMSQPRTQASAPKALFVTYEGIEGAGKSTQMKNVASHFEALGKRVCVTREPGGTPTAERIRSLLIEENKREPMHPKTELLLMQAARVAHVESVIKPSLRDCDLILCDRFIDSSSAYQGVGRDLGLEIVHTLNLFATDHIMPHLTFWIDIPMEVSEKRMRIRKSKSSKSDRFEEETRAFFQKVAHGYETLAQTFPERIVTLDGSERKEALVQQQIKEIEKRWTASNPS